MNKYISAAVLILIGTLPMAYAGSTHKHASDNSCWYESNYGSKKTGDNWAYYFCGPAAKKCDGKKHKGHDKLVLQYHGDKFTFKNSPKETYFCCGGTTSANGHYVRADKWIVDTKTEKISVSGGTCNKLTETDACGEIHITECDTPDNCPTGTILRNNECVRQCEGDEVFESTNSNNCISCETTIYQGPSKDHTACIKCNTTLEFFNRDTQTCIKKTDNKITQYAKETFRECWRCPYELHAQCVKAITAVNKMGLADSSRFSAINAQAASAGVDNIVSKCHLND